jgi:hypothetical protein
MYSNVVLTVIAGALVCLVAQGMVGRAGAAGDVTRVVVCDRVGALCADVRGGKLQVGSDGR